MLHVLHECFAAEEEFVTDGTASGVGAAEKGGVLLEHNTLLQLLFWPMDTRTPESHPRYHPRVVYQKRRTGGHRTERYQ